MSEIKAVKLLFKYHKVKTRSFKVAMGSLVNRNQRQNTIWGWHGWVAGRGERAVVGLEEGRLLSQEILQSD